MGLSITTESGTLLPFSARSGRPIVIRPGIDPDYFRPADDNDRELSIVFLGRFSYRPNVDAALEAALQVFPLVKRRVPGVRLTLVGSDPPRRIRDLAGYPKVVLR